jgi:hypothetical protein
MVSGQFGSEASREWGSYICAIRAIHCALPLPPPEPSYFHPSSSFRKVIPMKPSELFEALHALIGQRVPLHIWGACGVGKSQIVAQVASDLNWQFVDIRAVQLDPVDLRGLPRIAAVRGRVEQQVNAKSSVSVNYIGSRGIDLFRSVDVNAPMPPGFIARPNPQLGQERQLQSDGYQKSNALEIAFRGRRKLLHWAGSVHLEENLQQHERHHLFPRE